MIIVDLTPEEALAYEQCGNIENETEARNLLTLKLVFETKMAQDAAESLAAKIAAAAQRARGKIAEKTRFEIRVVKAKGKNKVNES